jgi:imidazolonepropionase-like amidohydrolase
LDGWTTEQMTIKKPFALHVFWPSMELNLTPRPGGGRRGAGGPETGGPRSLEEQAKERRAKLRALADFFEDARAYVKAVDAAAKNATLKPLRNPSWEAMLPYVRGELPVIVHADDLREIRAAVAWAATNHYKIILAGARDAWMAPELLATNKIPVIYEHTFTQPVRQSDPYDVHFKAPEVLRKAGVTVAFSYGSDSFRAPLTKDLPYAVAQAVAFGLPEDEALKALTLYPAQIAGVAERLGSIEKGKDASLIAIDGNLLDIRANVKRMWIAGKEVGLESKHTRLYEKYKSRPRAK